MPGSYRRADDLPLVIPVFPLDGALLLPGGQLPLNIFEPRYLNMFDDAMSGERIIGMVQTRPGGDVERPNLAPVGCAGRVTSFAETSDGRYLVTLTGVCRFRVGDELAGPRALSPGARRLHGVRGPTCARACPTAPRPPTLRRC
jgi:Lon protease-like protein